MIDEKKLINYIKAEINPYGKPFNDTAYEFGLKLIDYIEAMEKQPQVGDWIPVSERLPEVEGSYMTTTECGAVRVNHYYSRTKTWGHKSNKTIAWQPLPEPFKESDEKMSESVIDIIQEVCEIVCDELCKYRDSTDENCECDYIKKNGICPLNKLY